MGVNWTEEELQEYLVSTGQAQARREHVEEKARNYKEILTDIMFENMEMQAREDEPEPKFKSKTERRAYEWLPIETGCIEILYEPIMVRMNSGNYTPDFMLRMPSRELWFIEVKGSWGAYKSGRSSKKSLIEAAKMYWFLGKWFSLLPVKGGGWDMKEIK